MEKDIQSAPRRFWQTVRRLRRGKRGSIQAVYSKGGTLLTLTEEGTLGEEASVTRSPQRSVCKRLHGTYLCFHGFCSFHPWECSPLSGQVSPRYA
ncbi:hypothetical protein NHX12_002663 [Muraenolepis orangiensis]|uniref:Uncharacterized protein n=1 Tax=Muraenolepis orangiensis TaxID=630683 RepID=A0A9Q0DUX2_9TELE|nr:hypothetical protein NHX12_002663 [Muraenolepis orangiensis]